MLNLYNVVVREEPTEREVLIAQIDFIERGGRVVRCHAVPVLQPQNVAAHSFGVAWWCYLLTDGMPSADLLMAALQHDLAEHVTGDIPSPTKHSLEISDKVHKLETTLLRKVGLTVVALDPESQRILKVADCLELMQYCVRERSMGNRSKQLKEMYGNVRMYAINVASSEVESVAVETVNLNWSEANE